MPDGPIDEYSFEPLPFKDPRGEAAFKIPLLNDPPAFIRKPEIIPFKGLPTEAAARKTYPVATGVIDYFPDALVAIAHLSHQGNEQHNPGTPLHWDRLKSGDEADAAMRHFIRRGTLDTDGIGHSVKFAWRALALLQKEIEFNRGETK